MIIYEEFTFVREINRVKIVADTEIDSNKIV